MLRSVFLFLCAVILSVGIGYFLTVRETDKDFREFQKRYVDNAFKASNNICAYFDTEVYGKYIENTGGEYGTFNYERGGFNFIFATKHLDGLSFHTYEIQSKDMEYLIPKESAILRNPIAPPSETNIEAIMPQYRTPIQQGYVMAKDHILKSEFIDFKRIPEQYLVLTTISIWKTKYYYVRKYNSSQPQYSSVKFNDFELLYSIIFSEYNIQSNNDLINKTWLNYSLIGIAISIILASIYLILTKKKRDVSEE